MRGLLSLLIFFPFLLLGQVEPKLPTTSDETTYLKNQSDYITVSGEFSEQLKSKNGKFFLYEMIGNDDYLLDSASVNSGKFVFKKQLFYTGVNRSSSSILS